MGAHRTGLRVGAELRRGVGELRKGVAVLRDVKPRGGFPAGVVPPKVEEDGGLHRCLQKGAERAPGLSKDQKRHPAEGTGGFEALRGALEL